MKIFGLYAEKADILFNTFYNFFKNNSKLYLKGFITFRIYKYNEKIEKQIDTAVKEYIIEKEYSEFVSLLKLYVNTENSKLGKVHLIYREKNPLLFDENKKIIKTDINLLNAKYLSDISFSASDFILNTLLNIIPKKIYIHLIDKQEDEFINTLKLIFENRIEICTDCNICRIYQSYSHYKNQSKY